MARVPPSAGWLLMGIEVKDVFDLSVLLRLGLLLMKLEN